MTVEKPKPKQLPRPITTGAGSAMNQSQFLAIICNSLKAREKSRVHGAICFGFDSHWLKNWRESFKPITKRSNRNHVITFDSHLKTALRSSYHCEANVSSVIPSKERRPCEASPCRDIIADVFYTGIRELKQPRRRRQQKPHKFAYLTMKNSILTRLARAFFIF